MTWGILLPDSTSWHRDTWVNFQGGSQICHSCKFYMILVNSIWFSINVKFNFTVLRHWPQPWEKRISELTIVLIIVSLVSNDINVIKLKFLNYFSRPKPYYFRWLHKAYENYFILFYLRISENKFQNLTKFAKSIIYIFRNTYLCEKHFQEWLLYIQSLGQDWSVKIYKTVLWCVSQTDANLKEL